jgi:hypothetical protein
MTINSTSRFVQANGNGSATAFPFAFKVFAAADLAVYLTNLSTGVEQLLVLNTDYTVILNPDQNYSPGGTVTIPGGTVNVPAVVPNGTRVTISSAVPFLQPTDLSNQGGFYPDVINDALDRATILIQQLQNLTARLLIAPTTDGTGNLTIPNSALRANKYLAFGASGEPIVGTPAGTTDISYPGNVVLRANNGGANLSRDFIFMDNLAERARLLGSNGRFGLGTATPTEALDVVGNIKASGTGAGNITATGAGAFGGAVSGASGAFTGAVSGASGAFTGTVAIGAPSAVGHAMRLNDIVASSRVSLAYINSGAATTGSDGVVTWTATGLGTATVTVTASAGQWRGVAIGFTATALVSVSSRTADANTFVLSGATITNIVVLATRSGA